MRGGNEIRLEIQGGVEVEGCMYRDGVPSPIKGMQLAKVKRGGRDRRERRVRVYRVCVLKKRVLAVLSIRLTLVTD